MNAIKKKAIKFTKINSDVKSLLKNMILIDLFSNKSKLCGMALKIPNIST